jgi:hypothetical protein
MAHLGAFSLVIAASALAVGEVAPGGAMAPIGLPAALASDSPAASTSDASVAACPIHEPTTSRASTPTSACTGCHNRSNAAHTGHRVDIPYQAHSRLRPDPERFNPAVVLANGTITCLTCHDPRSTLPQHLAAPTGGRVEKRLCIACHVFS